MYYIIDPNIQIKKWQGGPAYYLHREGFKRYSLIEEDYELIKKCDGKTDITPCFASEKLELLGIIRPCEKDSACLLPDQIKEYPNYYVRNIDWNISDICNYRCLHCFHTADNSMQRDSFSWEEALRFLDEMRDCGLTGVRLTGGEPTLYPRFREILQAIKDRELRLTTLITNGSNLDEDLISFIKSIHPKTEIRISFDGIGHHDWLRQHKGAEEQFKHAVRLCKEAVLFVYINMNINRRNRDVIFDSVKMLAAMGVDGIRIIKTTEVPRWQLNGENLTLKGTEYYDFCVDFAEKFKNSGINVPVTIWQSLYLDPRKKTFTCLALKSSVCRFDENAPICRPMYNNKPSVLANGDIIPCAPMAGLFASKGIRMDNVKTDGLQKALTSGVFIDAITHTVGEKLRVNPKCGSCSWGKVCQGGCPAVSLLFGGSLLSSDPTKCEFFSSGYYEKYCRILEGWKNLNPI